MTNAKPHGFMVVLLSPMMTLSTGPAMPNSASTWLSCVAHARLPTYTVRLVYATRACASSRPYLHGSAVVFIEPHSGGFTFSIQLTLNGRSRPRPILMLGQQLQGNEPALVGVKGGCRPIEVLQQRRHCEYMCQDHKERLKKVVV